jgi:predicted site-specific integrase-resolvase
MIAVNQSSSLVDGSEQEAGGPHGLLTIGQASRRFGLHPNTLRHWMDREYLVAIRTVGGHRRIDPANLQALLTSRGMLEREKQDDGLADDPKPTGGQLVLCYARVSSNSQGKNVSSKDGSVLSEDGAVSDLKRQQDRLLSYARDKFNAEGILFSDKASGLSFTRPSFVKMLKGILEGRYDGAKLLVAYSDRLARFGTELVALMCEDHRIELIYIEDQDPKSAEVELVEDLLALTHLFSCRLYSKRSAATVKRQFDPDVSLEILRLSKQGLPVDECIKRLKGKTDLKGRPITRWVFQRFVRESGLLDKVMGDQPEANSFHRWAELFLVSVPARIDPKTGKAAKDTRLTKAEIMKHYLAWCKKQKLEPVTACTVGRYMRQRGHARTWNAAGRACFKEVQIRKEVQ